MTNLAKQKRTCGCFLGREFFGGPARKNKIQCLGLMVDRSLHIVPDAGLGPGNALDRERHQVCQSHVPVGAGDCQSRSLPSKEQEEDPESTTEVMQCTRYSTQAQVRLG